MTTSLQAAAARWLQARSANPIDFHRLADAEHALVQATKSSGDPHSIHLAILCATDSTDAYRAFSTARAATDYAASREVPCVVTMVPLDSPDYGLLTKN